MFFLLLVKNIDPIIRAPPLMSSPKPNYFPKVPSPDAIALGLGLSHMNFGRDIVWSIAVGINVSCNETLSLLIPFEIIHMLHLEGDECWNGSS